jgi:acetyl esterase/lipase
MPRRPVLLLLLALAYTGHGAAGPGVSFDAVTALSAPAPQRREPYGSDALQFGELWLPAAPAPAPVVVLVHGGCWLNAYGVDHARPLAAALAGEGFAVWALEYRRVGDAGGGWPGTGQDVLAGIAHLARLAGTASLDLGRVALVGHSAGGHLVLWAGGALPDEAPVQPAAVVGLAAITDPVAYARGGNSCETATPRFLGGPPEAVPDAYRDATPRPGRRPTVLLHGGADAIVAPVQARTFAAAAARAGATVEVLELPGFGHFDLIHPGTDAFPVLTGTLRRLLAPVAAE